MPRSVCLLVRRLPVRSSDRCILQRRSQALSTMRDCRLAKTDADLVKALEIRIRQIGISLTDVIDRLIHPVALIFSRSLKDTASVHVTEQLIAGSIKKFLFGQIILHLRSCQRRAFSTPGRDLNFSHKT